MARIKRVEIKNWIGLSEFVLEPGKINVFRGKKGSGKSSFVEALQKAFTNKNCRTEVVPHGENEATIYIQVDNGLEIDRRVRTDKADYLKLKKPGEAVPQTEAYLRKLINGEIFRPLEFVQKDSEEQTRIILNMLDIEWNMDNIKNWFGEVPDVNFEAHILLVLSQIENLYYSQRETINREIKTLEAQVQGIKDELPQNYEGDYWREQQVQEYYNKVAEAEEINKKIVNARSLIENLESRIQALKSEAESDKQIKKSQYDRERSEIKEYRQFLLSKIEKGQEKITQADSRIKQAEKDLDIELQAKIQKLKEEYAEKKSEARGIINNEVRELEKEINTCKETVAVKEQELANKDKLEEQALEAIDERLKEKIETENARAGNAKTIIETLQEIEVKPLRDKANEVAHMQSFLREYDRMKAIQMEKIAPKQRLSKELTAKIKKARELPKELLMTAKVPIPGITVDGKGQIRVNGTLIDGLSEGEQLEFAYHVAKAESGELQVICLDGIHKINESDRAWIEKEMETDDYQYFVTETVDGDLEVDIKN